MFMYLHKNRKGFTLIELMVVVAIIGILALLGLRLYLNQQIRAKNAIVKANAATVHTIIQGNLADTNYPLDAGEAADDAVNEVGDESGDALAGGSGDNDEAPAGMQNPHLTGDDNIVVHSLAGTASTDADNFVDNAEGLETEEEDPTYAGAVIVGLGEKANKFYIGGLDHEGNIIQDVYTAQK